MARKQRRTEIDLRDAPLEWQLPAWAPVAVLALLFAALTAWSWRKWPDILIDSGKELYVAWRLSAGEVLYRDLAFSMGPLSPYLNATLFRIFGVSMTTLFVANLAILVLIVSLIYALFLRAGGRFAATFVSATFLLLFCFSQYSNIANYNYVFPYRHEVTHGLALCLLSMWCLVRFAERGKVWLLFAAGMCTGAAAMTKLELFLPTAGAMAVGAALLALRRDARIPGGATPGLWGRAIVAFGGGAMLPIAFFVLLLARSMPISEAIGAAFTNWRLSATSSLTTNYPFYTRLMGLDDPSASLLFIGRHLLWMSIAGVILLAADRALRGPRWCQAGISIVVGLIAAAVAWRFVPLDFWNGFTSVLTLVPLVAGPVFLIALLKARGSQEAFLRKLPLVLWSIVSTLLILKMILNAQIAHYGFVLAMPAMLLLVYCLTAAVPSYLRRRNGGGGLFRAVALGLTLACAASYWQQSNDVYSRKTFAFGEGGDLTWHHPGAGPRVRMIPEVVKFLEPRMDADDTLFVTPEGAMVNYILRKRNSTPHYLLSPWEMAVAGGEAAVLDDLIESPPDFVVILQMPMFEHGVGSFGEPGYGDRILAWVRQNYTSLQAFQSRDARGGMDFLALVFEKNAAAAR